MRHHLTSVGVIPFSCFSPFTYNVEMKVRKKRTPNFSMIPNLRRKNTPKKKRRIGIYQSKRVMFALCGDGDGDGYDNDDVRNTVGMCTPFTVYHHS